MVIKKRIIIYLVLVIGFIVNVPPIYSTTIVPVDFMDLVTESEIIFTGTVVNVEAQWGMNGRIYTNITFDNLQIIKGIHPENTIVMELAGGIIGEYHSKVAGMPEFQVGGKHLIFLKGNRKYICPIVGWGQGKFNIVLDRTTGTEIILDDNNNPVTGIEGNMIMRAQRPAEQRGESFPGISPEHGLPLQQSLQTTNADKHLTLLEFLSVIEGSLGVSGEGGIP